MMKKTVLGAALALGAIMSVGSAQSAPHVFWGPAPGAEQGARARGAAGTAVMFNWRLSWCFGWS